MGGQEPRAPRLAGARSHLQRLSTSPTAIGCWESAMIRPSGNGRLEWEATRLVSRTTQQPSQPPSYWTIAAAALSLIISFIAMPGESFLGAIGHRRSACSKPSARAGRRTCTVRATYWRARCRIRSSVRQPVVVCLFPGRQSRRAMPAQILRNLDAAR